MSTPTWALSLSLCLCLCVCLALAIVQPGVIPGPVICHLDVFERLVLCGSYGDIWSCHCWKGKNVSGQLDAARGRDELKTRRVEELETKVSIPSACVLGGRFGPVLR